MTHLVYNVVENTELAGHFSPENDVITINCVTVWDEFITNFNALSEDLLIARFSDLILHEWVHALIDKCLDDDIIKEAGKEKLDDVDEHKIFKYLVC